MPVPFTIKVTKEILGLSKECGTRNDRERVEENCAIAHALKDIFPAVMVTAQYIYPLGMVQNNQSAEPKIEMPKIAQDFIKVFDSLATIYKVRLRLPEFEFEILIPDEIISTINIDELKTSFEERAVPELADVTDSVNFCLQNKITAGF